MINNKLLITVVAMAFCVGCSDEYEHDRLGRDGPEAQQIRAMVSVLRDGGPDALDKALADQALEKLSNDQLNALRSTLERIVIADSVELEKIEKFGEVYRVVLKIESSNGPGSLAMLAGMTSDDKLKWIGKN
ncbi:MAG: hypothetical protein GY794_01990 [bacterium]|nr:hypothetical protein [bacterium]